MKLRDTLFARILLWFFLSLVVLGVVVFAVFNLQFRLSPESPFSGYGQRVGPVGRLIVQELSGADYSEWDDVLERYSLAYGVQFLARDIEGQALAGGEEELPREVAEKIGRPPHAAGQRLGRRGGPGRERGGPPPRRDLRLDPPFTVRTDNPRRYWVGVPAMVRDGRERPEPITILAVSASRTGGGLFFDPTPWLVGAVVIVLLSIVLWIPLVRSITRPIAQVTRATREIALGRFDVKLNEKRGDEIGQLSHSINEMAERLQKLLRGQKRFLGDVAHELASPIARLQLGLSILEQRLTGDNQERVQDVLDEARHMSNLVNELLSFSRAEINPKRVQLQSVSVAEVVRRVVERETTEGAAFEVEVPSALHAIADAELLVRAVGNLVRNSTEYAGDAPIRIRAWAKGDQVVLEVRDHGPGVPEETLGDLFEPFFRPDTARERETGGVGLGLAIVKTCVQTCQGSVNAKNASPTGLLVTITLQRA
jgi:signal transduction histidine kinase